MKDLEVGMYCYNKLNRKLGIGQIISFQSNNNVNIRYKNDIELVSIGNIVASFSPIDLIEVRDYVNGVEVEKITDNEIMLVDTHLYIDKSVANDFIETILTHEQFENNCYKIGGE